MKLPLRPSCLAHLRSLGSTPQSAGFSLVELVSVMTCVGLLVAIAAPGWLGFAKQRQLATAQEQAALAMRTAQHQAKVLRIRQAINFRQTADGIEWSVHPASHSATHWRSLAADISIHPSTTLERNGEVYRLQFDEAGHVSGQLGRLTLTIEQTGWQRCVITSTLLGTMRQAQGRACGQ
jgi:type II secretory pathway pseudopilin PulG